MKIVFFLSFFIAIIVLCACVNLEDSEGKDKTKREIIDLMDRYAECYKEKKLDCVTSLYSDGDSTIALAPAKHIKAQGREKIGRLYSRDLKSGWEMKSFEYDNIFIDSRKNVAWLSADVVSRLRIDTFQIVIESRLTGVCEKIDADWKFVMTDFQHFRQPRDILEQGKKKDTTAYNFSGN